MMLEGISKRIYGTKNMVNAILYCVEPGAILKSSWRPKMMALAIFVLPIEYWSAMLFPRVRLSCLGISPVQESEEI